MRDINVWAYHAEFGSLCRNAQLDASTGLRYPQGNTQGQASWHVAVRFGNLDELAAKFRGGIPMPRQYCGNWFSDCDPIRRGEVVRLAILAHGDQGGRVFFNGQNQPAITAGNVRSSQQALHNIGLLTREEGSTVLLMGCLAGQGEPGTRLLQALSRIWPGRRVVGFSTIGYRHPGSMKRRGEACELPGMRDTDAPAYLFANPHQLDQLWSNFDQMPWASERSPHAKVVKNGRVLRNPEGESTQGALSPFEQRLGTQMMATSHGHSAGRTPGPVHDTNS